MKTSLVIGALCAAACLSSSANATVMVATFNGTLGADAVDFAGDFGAPGSLAGKAFTATFVYDTELGSKTTTADYQYISGGVAYGLDAIKVITSATLTINNITQVVDIGNGLSFALAAQDQFQAALAEKWDDYDLAESGDFLTVVATLAPGGNDLSAPYTSNELCQDCFQFWLTDANGQRTSQSILPSNVTSTTVAPQAVPEPSTWALLILGFGGAGATLRRRRTVAA